jgi:hypothetical protein
MADANVAKKAETLPALNLAVMEQDANSGLQTILKHVGTTLFFLLKIMVMQLRLLLL